MTEISSFLQQDQVELGDDDSYNHAFAILRHRGQLLFAAHYSIIPDLFLHYFKLFVHLSTLLPQLLRWSGRGESFHLVFKAPKQMCKAFPLNVYMQSNISDDNNRRHNR